MAMVLPRYVGRLYVKSYSKPIEILSKLKEMAGFDLDEEIELYEVCTKYPWRLAAY